MGFFTVAVTSVAQNSVPKLEKLDTRLMSPSGQQLDWYEENFRMVLNWFANLYASEEALVAFYEQLLQLGIYCAEEMLLIDEREIEDCRWFSRAQAAELVGRQSGSSDLQSPPPGAIAHHLIRDWLAHDR